MKSSNQVPIFVTPQPHKQQEMTTIKSGVTHTHTSQNYGTKEHENQESNEI